MKIMLVTGSDKFLDADLARLESKFHLVRQRLELNIAELTLLLMSTDIYVLGGNELVTEEALRHSEVKTIIFVGIQWETSFTAEAKELLLARGIKVLTTGGGLVSVAETVVKLAAYPNLIRAMAAKRGIWQEDYHKAAASLKVVVIGAGNIGTQVAVRLKRTFPRTFYFSSSKTIPELADQGVQKLDDIELAFLDADIVSIHLAYLEGVTDSIITPERIALMRPDGLLINASRAQLIKDVAGFARLVTSELRRQYFFDVFWREGLAYQELFATQSVGANEAEQLEALRSIASSPNFRLFCHSAAVSDEIIARRTKREYGAGLCSIIEQENL